MPVYFAYGSNMDEAALRRRSPGARRRGLAVLPGHRFVLLPDAYASVEPAEGHEVHGVLFDLEDSDVPPLDDYEDVAGGLYIKTFRDVIAAGAAPLEAMIYIGTGKASDATAPPSYLKDVVAQARKAGLPAAYIEMLDAISRRYAGAQGSNS